MGLGDFVRGVVNPKNNKNLGDAVRTEVTSATGVNPGGAAAAGGRVKTAETPRYDPATGKYFLDVSYSDGSTDAAPTSRETYLIKGGDPSVNLPAAPAPSTTAPNIPGASAQPAAPLSAADKAARLRAAGAPSGQAAFTGAAPRAPTGAAPAAASDAFQRAPGAAPAPAAGAAPGYATVDYSRYDQAAKGYDQAVSAFQSELDRLSGVDPFGNQAFLRKATDRALGQAQALASGGLSTATARAGNMRQAQGVQASLASQGRDQMAVQRAQDEQTAAGLRVQAAGGLANTVAQRAGNETELTKLQTQTMAQNLDSYLKKYSVDAQLDQNDVESLRQMALAYSQLDLNRYKTDVDYATQQDQLLMQKYGIDQQKYLALKQIAAQENISPGEFLMGMVGAGAGLAGGIATAPAGSLVNPTSDRRAKFDVRDPDLRDLEDFLGRTKGKLYRYREPNKPGRRPGLNYGPMAQALAKSKIGRTVVTTDEEGTLRVDAARLALADHAALAALAAEVKALKGGK